MSDVVKSPARPGLEATHNAERFDRVSIALHWATAILVLGQFFSAWIVELGIGSLSLTMLTVHRSTGTLTWMIVLARLIWRHGYAHLPPFPPSMPRLQQRVATANEYALYAALLAQPLTGLADTLFRGRAFDLFVWQVPPLLAIDRPLARLFHQAHEFGATLLVCLIGLHAAAALFHGLILRDGVLRRMLPGTAAHRARSARAV